MLECGGPTPLWICFVCFSTGRNKPCKAVKITALQTSKTIQSGGDRRTPKSKGTPPWRKPLFELAILGYD
jgi:hypothetical protein